MNMTIAANRWPINDSAGLDIFKIKIKHEPNDEWKWGFGIMLFNAAIMLYWGRK
jgi:hypothetical protein